VVYFLRQFSPLGVRPAGCHVGFIGLRDCMQTKTKERFFLNRLSLSGLARVGQPVLVMRLPAFLVFGAAGIAVVAETEGLRFIYAEHVV
jgi:hypothetical protein